MRRIPLILLLTGLTACEGKLIGPRGGGPPAPTDPTLPAGAPREFPSLTSRASRLSHTEYENTVRDLLGAQQSLGITSNFVNDATSTTFDNNGAELTVASDQWTDYQAAAEEVARQATLSTTVLTRVAGGLPPSDGPSLVRMVGRRVFRRPLTDAEVTDFANLFAQGTAFYPNTDPVLSGARVVLEAMLQSPYFLYRVETSTQARNGVVPLTAHELATRLSYALWQSMPDWELFQAADDGTLLTAEGYTAQVNRLLADARARDTVRSFHAQLLQVGRYADITRSTTLFPEFTPALRASMAEEQARFVESVVFADNGGVADLLTARYTMVDAPLARVYGLQGTFGAGFQKFTFTGEKRGGLLTQVGFLTANASSTESDPVHRGVFINHKLLCANLPPPPNMVPALPAPDPNNPKTLRQRLTEFTGAGTCGAGCHSTMINPVGFAFENYDALGRWRTAEKNGLAIDSRDSYSFEGTLRPFADATELATIMSEESMTHRCYAQHWIEFLHARGLSSADEALVKRAGAASQKEKLPVRELMRTLVESESFKARAVEQ